MSRKERIGILQIVDVGRGGAVYPMILSGLPER